MKEFNYTNTDEIGIHARPAGMLAKKAKAFESSVTIAKGEKEAALSKLMAVMALGVKHGDTVTVKAEGADEEAAIAEIKKFFEENL